MNEHIAALFTGNEAKAFGIIEPLYGTCLHDELPPSCELKRRKGQKNTAKSICLCGFPTRTSGTSVTDYPPSARECQQLLSTKVKIVSAVPCVLYVGNFISCDFIKL